ncbi:hypothetical protein [Sanyastnella coralliicola]|uniref:hypothetical protein n=1 Tax=Sanyastnella coralliicola TaxID=3069118 RepID=UPI0027BA0EEC|nr:hypothetical protein [Longitalea sp. SCSIO 12813]
MSWWKKQPIEQDNPEKLNWGPVNPDLFKDGACIHIMNCDLQDTQKRTRTINFALDKFKHFAEHLPNETKQIFTFDIRGQLLSSTDIQAMKEKVEQIPNINFEFEA